MASDNKLELVVTVEVDKANQSLKTVNVSLSNLERAATKAARGASEGVDGMTASMVKGATAGNLLADAIQSALHWAKEWTIGAAKDAAHVARMESATRALAKAHGINAQSMQTAVAAVQEVGFENEAALRTINRLIVADLDLSKAQGLAKLAKDAAALEENLAPQEALEKIVQAIEFGNARALRTVGLRLDFENEIHYAELKLGRTLSENEKVQIRYNAVMREAAKIQGAGAAASTEAESQMRALGREVKDLREAVGARFQDEFKAIIGYLRDLVRWLRNNTGALEAFAKGALAAAGLGVWWAGNKLLEHAQGNKELDTTAEAIKKINERLKETPEWWIQRGLVPPKTAKDRLIEYIKSLDEKKAAAPAKKEPTIEELERAAAIRKRQREIERETLETALGAETQELTGIFRLIGEFRREIAKYTTFVDDKGIEHRIQLTARTRENVERELHSKVRAMQREEMAEYVKEQEEINQQGMEIETRRFKQRLDNDDQIARRNLEHIGQVYAFEEQRAGFERDARLREIEGVDAQTLAQKIAVEQRKAEIEVEYLEKVHEVKQRLYDMDTSRMLLEEELTLKRLGYRADEIKARIAELSQQREDIRQQSQEATDAAIQASRENAANRTAQLVREHNRTIFDSLKQQAGGVFDALLQKSQSVWSAIANSFKTALLTAIKEVVTSRVAAALMSLFTGQKVTFAGGAMIGAKFGGPLGAAIGAGVGFVAGLVRLFVKSAEEKAREKIKALYGVDISDKGVLKQIVDTAKQAFGGNLDVAIRSQQIRDLVQLYAMSTGQPTRGMPATVHPLDIVQQGGSLYQSPGYSNGAALPGLGGLPTLDSIGGGVASGAGPGATVVNLQIDSKTVGNVIIQNGRVVAQGAINAMKANAGRRELTALQVSPGLVTA